MFPSSAREVAAALLNARDRGLPFRVRSGGHSVDGFSSVEGGIVIDLGKLDSIEVSDDMAYATIGVGTQIHCVYERLADVGRAVPGGIGHTVGVGGFTTGGGMGTLARWLGAMAHNVVSLEAVDAQGRIVHADREQNSDLFWACLGAGGGNFAIITSLRFRITPLAFVTTYRLSWSWEDFEDVYRVWESWAPYTDNRLTAYIALWPTTLANRVDVGGVFPGTETELQSLLRPLLREVPRPIDRRARRSSFPEAIRTLLAGIAEESFDIGARAITASPTFDAPLDDTAVQALREWHTKAPCNSFTWSFPGGGALTTETETGATSFAHGVSAQNMLFRSDWTEPADDAACVAWAQGIYNDVRHRVTGAYLNWTNVEIEARPHMLYGDGFPRLMQIKHRYDPQGVFGFSHSIPATLSRTECVNLELPGTMVAEIERRGLLRG
ncbi:FAD-binding oxidoreductase [Nocardia sp. NPDC050175]|uniref:FAD-binding oxidoreductase n=1 Tax=Nocardia sp. NPDC050175 TaxID=3364317 RepID=UPI0037BA8C70